MSAGGWIMAAVIVITVATLALLVVAMARSIADERTPGRSIWREFGLSIVLGILLLSTWVGQLVAQCRPTSTSSAPTVR